MSNNVVDIVVQLTDKNAKAGLEKIAATSKGTVAELSKLKNEMFANRCECRSCRSRF